MLRRNRRWLWIAVAMLAMEYGALALVAEKQKNASLSQMQSSDKQKETEQPADPSQYVGSETCKTCYEQAAAGYEKSPHSKAPAKHEGPQWQGCEACHGPGKAHAESGDPDKIIRLTALSREESSNRCMACHQFGQEHTNSLRSEHIKSNVGCIDCHSIHAPGFQARLLKATMPQLCYSCHMEVKTDSSKPFHRGVNQGLVSCNDCHNPHGGPANSGPPRPKT